MNADQFLLAIHGIIIAIQFVLLYMVFRVLTALTLSDSKGTTPDNTPQLKTIADGVSSLLSEFLPKGGASISLRVNNLNDAAHEAALNAVSAKSAVEEMRGESRAVRETNARQELLIGQLNGKLDALALAQAALVREQTQLLTLVQRMEVGQAAAGSDIGQTKEG
jgi:hypothetical protein